MRIRTTMMAVVLGLLAFGVTVAAVGQPLAPLAGGGANKRAARRDAPKLLARLLLPTGAAVSARDPAVPGRLSSPASEPGTPALVDVHRFYRVPGNFAAVIAWFQSHRPAGTTVTLTGSASGPGYEEDFVGLAFKPIAGSLPQRQLLIEGTDARGGGTAVRVDAQDVWWIPRPKSERVPASARVIDVTIQRINQPAGSTSTSKQTVTDSAKVNRIISLVNGLAPAQPGAYSCPPGFGPDVTLSFLGAPSGSPLATAVADGAGCGVVTFKLGGRAEPGLSGGPALIGKLGKLLGFTP